MHFLPTISAGIGLLAVVAASSAQQSRTNTPQDGNHAVPTITMKQDKHRIHKRWEGPTPVHSEIFIHPTGVDHVPKNGFDIRFGPELAKSLRTALRVYCQHHNAAKCIDRLVEILDRHGELTHHKRQLGAGQYLAAPLIGAAIYYFGSHKNPTGLHLPSKPVAQVSQHPDAKGVVFKSAPHDNHPMTYNSPTKTGSAHVSVQTEHSNKGHHHKGDVIIHVPEVAAHFMHKMLAHTKECNAKHLVTRGAEILTANDAEIMQHAIKQMLSRGDGAIPIDHMLLGKNEPMINLPLMHLNASKPGDHVKGILKWMEYNHIRQLMKLKIKARRWVIQLMWVAAYESCVVNHDSLDVMVIPSGNKHVGICPKDAPRGKDAPFCVNCHGWERGICKKGVWKGCPCLFVTRSTHYHESEHIWNMREHILQKVLEGHHEKPKVECEHQLINAESDTFKKAFKELCKNPLTAGGNGKKIVNDGLEFTLKHEWHKNKCARPKWNHEDHEKECLRSFREFWDYTECIPNSHVLSKNGHYHSHCATSTFHVKKAKPKRPHEGPLHCHPSTGCYNEINSKDHVREVARGWCYRLRQGLIKGRHMKAGDPQVNFDLRALMGTNFFARWMDGCKLEQSHDIAGPHCEGLFYKTWANCDGNGGRGGWHREGCVAMGMHPVCT